MACTLGTRFLEGTENNQSPARRSLEQDALGRFRISKHHRAPAADVTCFDAVSSTEHAPRRSEGIHSDRLFQHGYGLLVPAGVRRDGGSAQIELVGLLTGRTC